MSQKISNRKLKSIANKMDDLNNRIKRMVAEIEESGHPNAQEMADTLRENGYDNPARALDCIEDLLVKRGLTPLAPDGGMGCAGLGEYCELHDMLHLWVPTPAGKA